MKNTQLYAWLSAAFLFVSVESQAQVSYSLMPIPATILTVRQVGQIQVTNPGATTHKYISLILRKDGELVLASQYDNIEIRPGTSIIPLGTLTPTVKNYGGSDAANQLSLTGKLVGGNYNVCVSVADQPVEASETCQPFEVKPLTPPMLIHPDNEATVPTINPLLTWMPPAPNEPGITYSLRLTQIDEGQTALDALERNPIIYLAEGLTKNIQVYPPTATPLVPGKKYAWQVEAFNGSYSLGITEVWDFLVQEPEIKAVAGGTSFFKVKKRQDGTHCIADPVLKIMIPSVKMEEPVHFWITDGTGHIIKPYTRAATLLHLQPGDNFFAIDLTETAELESGQYYFMSMKTSSGEFFIAFQYVNNQPKN